MTLFKRRALVVGIALMLSTGIAAQERGSVPATLGKVPNAATTSRGNESCAATGVVVNGISGDPVRRAQIKAKYTAGTNQLSTNTNVDGRFLLSGIFPGTYRITVHKKGYLETAFDVSACQQGTTSKDQVEAAGPSVITLRLMPLSAISGHVTDDAGEPVLEAVVHAKQASRPGGPLHTAATATTDDLGMYRLHGLRPGAYYISAGPPQATSGDAESTTGDSVDDSPTTYYPQGSDVRGATLVSVEAGTSPSGIDIALVKGMPDAGAVVLVPASLNSGSSPSLPSSGAGLAAAANPEKATMTGTIVNEVTSEPVRRAKVTLEPTRNGGSSYAAQTDATGQFLIKDIDAGTYRAVVERAGFLPTPHLSGAPSQMPASLTLKPKQAVRDVVLRVTPSSVVTGRVFDQDGDAAQDFQVQALRLSNVRGKTQLQTVASAVTNDLGEYRLYGLSRGKYYVSTSAEANGAQNQPEAAARYVATYYPQALDLEGAAPVNVGAGQQVEGIDLWARLSALVEVRGRVVSPSGPISSDTVVTLTRTSADAAEISFNLTQGVDPQGRFTFSAVPPGAYTVSAVYNDDNGQYAAAQTLEVTNTTLDNIDLQLNRATSVSGRIQVEGGATVKVNSVRVLLQPDSNSPTGSVAGDVNADGSFSVSGILPDQYTLEVIGLPDEYYVKTIRVGGEEARSSKIDLRHAAGALNILVSPGASITGSVADDNQQAAAGMNVVLIPNSPANAAEPYKTAASDREGKFKFVGLAPGTYQLFAIDGVDPDSYMDADFIASLRDYAEAITVQDNSTPEVDLKVVSASTSR